MPRLSRLSEALVSLADAVSQGEAAGCSSACLDDVLCFVSLPLLLKRLPCLNGSLVQMS